MLFTERKDIVKNIEQLASEYIEQAKAQIEEHTGIKALLVSLEGKALDHRTFNKKRLGCFKFEQKHGMAYINSASLKRGSLIVTTIQSTMIC